MNHDKNGRTTGRAEQSHQLLHAKYFANHPQGVRMSVDRAVDHVPGIEHLEKSYPASVFQIVDRDRGIICQKTFIQVSGGNNNFQLVPVGTLLEHETRERTTPCHLFLRKYEQRSDGFTIDPSDL